ncbi:hypothetical protein AB1N83_010773 [Pleurotus pulmonarius]
MVTPFVHLIYRSRLQRLASTYLGGKKNCTCVKDRRSNGVRRHRVSRLGQCEHVPCVVNELTSSEYLLYSACRI